MGDAIALYWPPRRWQRLWSQPGASFGALCISPDSSLIAAELRPQPREYLKIWLFCPDGTPHTEVSALLPARGRSADFSPQWSADGDRLMIRRVHDPDGSGMHQTTELLCYYPATQAIEVLLPATSDPLVACFGPGDSLIERRGGFLRIVSRDGSLRELMDGQEISGAIPSDVGLQYSAKLNAVAFTMVRGPLGQRQQNEIWLLSLASGAGPPRRLFAASDSRIIEIGFATP
ncbi:MAG: hypothetical protein ACRD1C_08275 [Terriglobales bacterium]